MSVCLSYCQAADNSFWASNLIFGLSDSWVMRKNRIKKNVIQYSTLQIDVSIHNLNWLEPRNQYFVISSFKLTISYQDDSAYGNSTHSEIWTHFHKQNMCTCP